MEQNSKDSSGNSEVRKASLFCGISTATFNIVKIQEDFCSVSKSSFDKQQPINKEDNFFPLLKSRGFAHTS